MALARLPALLVATAITSIMLVAPSITVAQDQSAGAYTLNRAASAVGFTISASMLFKVKRDGNFKDFSGNLSYDPEHPANTQMDLTIYTASVDMHNAENEQLLKSGDFFDVEHFPTMHFVSAATIPKPDGTFSMTGDMTIRGVTKRMTIPVKMRRGDPSSPVFESSFQIDRTEFGLNGLPKWGGMKVSIGKNVEVHIAIATSANAPGMPH
jgi:polyisoprenoid-binding protein YceI